MLTHFRMKNFKSWRDTGNIRLAPITVFFGPNSSGKSSIGQFLMMLKQTAQSSDRKRVFHYGDKSSIMEFGTYRDIVFDHNDKEQIKFEFEWTLPKNLSLTDTISNNTYTGKTVHFEGSIGLTEDKTKRTIVETISYALKENDEEKIKAGMERKVASSDQYALFTDHFTPIRTPGKPWPLSPPIRFYGFSDEIIARYQNLGFLRDLTLELEKCFKNIRYLGPIRNEQRQRSYVWSGEEPEDVGFHGERTVEAILSAKDRKMSKGPNKNYNTFERIIARWLKQMGLISSFTVKRIGPYRQEYEVKIKTMGSSKEVLIPDVGFGVSQVLPVLVQCFYAPPGSTIIMEQPEIHLHPSVQSSLADLFIEVINSREDGKNRGIQLLIESHSEHFLRRLQRRIAEGVIGEKETALYFCRKNSSASEMESLQIDALGSISNWPENFFGDEMEDLIAMTDAAMQKQMGDA